MPQVSALWIYPVKALGGIRLSEAEVTPAGLAGDRRWMVVDEAGGFLSRRTSGAMCGVEVSCDGDEFVLASAGAGRARIPRTVESSESIPVTIWSDTVNALAGPADADEWISAVLGRPCRLVFQADSDLRAINPRYGRAGDVVSFADGYPALLVTEASVGDLNERMRRPVTMTRFRPNIVVTGTGPYDEDGWGSVAIGSTLFENVKPCIRCVVLDTDPETGLRAQGVLRALARYRKWETGVRFGVNLVPRSGGSLSVGDRVSVESASLV